MKIQRQRIIFIIFFLISIIIGYLLWDLINLKFKDQGIIGLYSIKGYNASNDILRYIIFLILPCTTLIFYKFFTHKNFLSDINNFLITKEKNTEEIKKILLYIFIFC